MINDLDETIKQLLIKNVPLDPAEVDISFEMPGREWSASIAKPTVNLYLYSIQENRDLRMAAAEKMAAALPPKLTVPMIVFFLPVLFVVILGPAAIKLMKM